jgi:hypothetical protein
MKRIYFALCFAAITLVVFGQSVQREMVILEKGTGTWCTWCPSAAVGAEELLENGCQVAVVSNHNGDSYANAYSNARNSMYQLTGYPTAIFDGKTKSVGGSTSGSTYPAYVGIYNTRYAVPSPVIMDMEIENTDDDYSVTITIEKVDNITSSDLRLVFFVTESEIPQTWFNQTTVEHVNRMMVPDQDGTSVDFSSGDIQTVTLDFSLQANWVVEHIEFVAALQNYEPGQTGGTFVKEMLNGIKRGAIDLVVDFEASETHIDKNTEVTFTSEVTGGYQGPVPVEYEWFIPGAEPDYTTDENPTVNYWQCGTHDVTLVLNKGGQIDTVIKENYMQVGPVVTITTTPGDTVCWYESITLDAANPDAVSYMWEPGGATTPAIEVWGSEVSAGTHEYTVSLTSAGGCINEASHTIYFDECVGIEEGKNPLSATVYPNPTNGTFRLDLTTTSSQEISLSLINNLGAVIYQEHDIRVDRKLSKTLSLDLPSGSYYMILRSDISETMLKVFVTH